MRIEKVIEENLEEALMFLIQEELKLILELNPEYSSEYESIKKFYINETYDFYQKRKGTLYTARVQEKIIGIGYMTEDGYLASLFVKEEYRNLGIGSKILKTMLEESSQKTMIRVDARRKAMTLYKRFHFQEDVVGLSKKEFVPMELDRRVYGK